MAKAKKTMKAKKATKTTKKSKVRRVTARKMSADPCEGGEVRR
jgi:hypothetical protein